MRITITMEDIEAGRRRDPNECPLARALRRAGISHFGVTGMLVIVQTGRTHVPLVLPVPVQEWILDFDWGSPMAPLEFELTLPEELERQYGNGNVCRDDEEPKLVLADGGGPWVKSPARWSASAKDLLGRPFRRCPGRRKAHGQAPAGQGEKLVAS